MHTARESFWEHASPSTTSFPRCFPWVKMRKPTSRVGLDTAGFRVSVNLVFSLKNVQMAECETGIDWGILFSEMTGFPIYNVFSNLPPYLLCFCKCPSTSNFFRVYTTSTSSLSITHDPCDTFLLVIGYDSKISGLTITAAYGHGKVTVCCPCCFPFRIPLQTGGEHWIPTGNVVFELIAGFGQISGRKFTQDGAVKVEKVDVVYLISNPDSPLRADNRDGKIDLARDVPG